MWPDDFGVLQDAIRKECAEAKNAAVGHHLGIADAIRKECAEAKLLSSTVAGMKT